MHPNPPLPPHRSISPQSFPDRGSIPRFAACMALIAAAAMLSSCARTQVEHRVVNTGRLPAPDVLVVNEFSVSPDEVALDHTIGLRLQELLGEDADDRERLRIAQEISALVSRELAASLARQGFRTIRGAAAAPAGARVLEIDGQFLSIDQGSQRQRMIVGFGLGASEVRVLVQAFEVTDSGRELVDDFYITTQSSRRPGMGPMAGGGAVAANVGASMALSGTTALIGARAQTVEADARNLADRIAAELQQYFVTQGWVQQSGDR